MLSVGAPVTCARTRATWFETTCGLLLNWLGTPSIKPGLASSMQCHGVKAVLQFLQPWLQSNAIQIVVYALPLAAALMVTPYSGWDLCWCGMLTHCAVHAYQHLALHSSGPEEGGLHAYLHPVGFLPPAWLGLTDQLLDATTFWVTMQSVQQYKVRRSRFSSMISHGDRGPMGHLSM
jgi:hypothetical protein